MVSGDNWMIFILIFVLRKGCIVLKMVLCFIVNNLILVFIVILLMILLVIC